MSDHQTRITKADLDEALKGVVEAVMSGMDRMHTDLSSRMDNMDGRMDKLDDSIADVRRITEHTRDRVDELSSNLGRRVTRLEQAAGLPEATA